LLHCEYVFKKLNETNKDYEEWQNSPSADGGESFSHSRECQRYPQQAKNPFFGSSDENIKELLIYAES
jgi:hypothetical protein